MEDKLSQDGGESPSFDLLNLMHILNESVSILESVRLADIHDQWLAIFEIHQILYAVVVKNTCLDLHNFNKLSKLQGTMDLPPEDWISLIINYCNIFLNACQAELDTYGNTKG